MDLIFPNDLRAEENGSPTAIHVASQIFSRTHQTFLTQLAPNIPRTILRAPDVHDVSRWIQHRIDGQLHAIAQPITFTPYAAVKPCSARCLFCSENLRRIDTDFAASRLRPGENYFRHLKEVLKQLRGLPMAYSLSGLEMTDDAEWMSDLLDALSRHAAHSPIQERVLYSNAAGLAVNGGQPDLIRKIIDFDMSWIEVSRHHFDEQKNQAIMRFRDGMDVRHQEVFERSIRQLSGNVPVKLVCIVQHGGIDSAEAIDAYIRWAATLGVRTVIFRQLSALDASYKSNATSRYINRHQLSIQDLLKSYASQKTATPIEWLRSTDGYYFWNIAGHIKNTEIIFEAADYGQMHRFHDSGRIYKLVIHANGNLCAGWDPEQHVLLRGQ
jgi:hypothetical protein